MFQESFSFVQEGVAWFGPTFHVVLQVQPDVTEPVEPAGCSTTGSGSCGGIAFALLALVGLRRRR